LQWFADEDWFAALARPQAAFAIKTNLHVIQVAAGQEPEVVFSGVNDLASQERGYRAPGKATAASRGMKLPALCRTIKLATIGDGSSR
jgi:hypothetical protein